MEFSHLFTSFSSLAKFSPSGHLLAVFTPPNVFHERNPAVKFYIDVYDSEVTQPVVSFPAGTAIAQVSKKEHPRFPIHIKNPNGFFSFSHTHF